MDYRSKKRILLSDLVILGKIVDEKPVSWSLHCTWPVNYLTVCYGCLVNYW